MKKIGSDYKNFFSNAQSLKNYLKEQSIKNEMNIYMAYEHYFSRKFLERLDAINYGKLLLKGCFSQYIHLGEMTRPTTDIDLAGTQGFKENFETIKAAVNEYFSDNLKFSFSKENEITKTKIVKIKLMAEFDSIKQPVSIDLMNNYSKWFEIQYKELPCTFKYDNSFYFNTLSHEEHLAEKLLIISKKKDDKKINTRVKDFYDIYQLHGGKYDSEKFSKYFYEMVKNWNEITIEELTTEFLNAKYIKRHQEVWDNSVNKYNYKDKTIDFNGAVYYSRAVLSEQIQKIKVREKQK